MDNIAEKVLDDCVFSHASAHARTLELREQKKLEEERKKRQAVKDTEIRKKNRRLARAKAEKDAKVAALKAEIRKVFFERAEVIHPATSNELIDFHGNYLKKTENSTWNAFTGAIGGHIQQLYYVVSTIMEMFDTDLVDFYDRARADPTDPTLKSASNPRELMID
jgi:hypothetical protein